MNRIYIKDTVDKEGQTVLLKGWVAVRRDHGKLIFFDLRDRTGIMQLIINPKVSAEAHAASQEVRNEYVIEVEGKINPRMEKQINPDMITGKIELEVTALKVLNKSEPAPMALDTDGMEIGEDVRMKYRYLDLRRNRLQKNIITRHRVIKHIRDFLDNEGFLEIETPILTKSTPEGARDYLVPARLQPGHFYALPQSPQQYKQLLMVAGMERYFQIARCFRDEDTRGDRQPEFTQMDLEMSFVEREDVMAMNEKMLIDIVTKHFPEKKIQTVPFPRISYKEAMEKYGTDRPDMREDKNDPNLLAFCWVIDFPFFEKTDEGGWTFTHNPFSAAKPEHMADLMAKQNIGEILTTQYDVALNGFEIGGGSIRNHQPDALRAVFNIMGFEDAKIDEQFGHMIQALGYGAPPHGGIAWGLDRFITLLNNEPNIREVIAFPKTGDGRDLMMDSPATATDKQLRELHIKVDAPKKKE
jgi:aspartyl-tRNA synthetase